MRKIISFGESIVDMIFNPETNTYTKQAGGAPANVASCAAKLGYESYLISKLGKDCFGEFLAREYKSTGLKLDYTYYTSAGMTPLAFVHHDKNKSPQFSFYRSMTADMLLSKDEINPAWFSNAIFHMGTLSLADSPMKFAHIKAVDLAKKNQCIISFDPNIRLSFWKNANECMFAVKSVSSLADIIKVSTEDLEFITQTTNHKDGIDALFQGTAKLVIHTLGKDGAIIHTPYFEVSHPGFVVDTVDTTGAGDAFMGAFLGKVAEHDKPLDELTKEELYEMLRFSNAVAAISTTQKGAISSLPTKNQVLAFLNEHNEL